MDIPASDSHLREIFLQLFSHPLGKGRDKHPFIKFRPLADLLQQVVHLVLYRTHLDRRIQESCRTYYLLDNETFGLFKFIFCRGRTDEHLLTCDFLEFVELQRAVVCSRRETESIFYKDRLSRMVSSVHRSDLRQGDMALVDECDEVLWEIIYQAERAHAFASAVEISRIVLDSRTISHLLDEFEIIFHALLQSFGFQMLAYAPEVFALG